MVPILPLIALVIIFLVICRNKILQKLIEKWRFINLINQLPGPSLSEILRDIMGLKFNREQFSSQMGEMFHKYAYQNELGITCCWFGFRPMLFLTRSTSAKVVFESTASSHKSDDYDIFKRLVGDGLFNSSGKTWSNARRMLRPAFHLNLLQNYVEIFNSQAKVLLGKLEKQCDTNETFDLLPYLSRYGMDVISETTMGVTIDAQNNRNRDQFYESLRTVLFLMWAYIRYPWFWFAPIRWLYGFDKKLDYYCKMCKKLTAEIIAARKIEREANGYEPTTDELSASGKKRVSFLDLLLSIREENNLTDEDICGHVNMFLIAGSDGVASQIGYNLFALGHRQHYQDKIYAEINRIIGDTERFITMDDVHELKYLGQCISETSRYTPNAVLLGRKLTSDINICGYTVPAGITCIISPYAIMRDPKHYDNPEQYDPEHFSPEKVSKRDPFSFVPFSAGIRNCLGNRFAILEITITLAYILQRYRVISMLPESENILIPEFTLRPSKGFPIRLERR